MLLLLSGKKHIRLRKANCCYPLAESLLRISVKSLLVKQIKKTRLNSSSINTIGAATQVVFGLYKLQGAGL